MIITTQDITIIVGIVLLIGYPIFMRVLAQIVQPSRLRMLEIGKELLANSSVPKEHKHVISSMLDDAYSPTFMIYVSIIMPYYAICKLARRIAAPPPIEDIYVRRLHNEFFRRYISAVAVANPAFTVIAATEMAILTVFLFPFGQLWRAQDVQFGTIEAVDRTMQSVDRILHRRAA
jgi:hypothetical protein